MIKPPILLSIDFIRGIFRRYDGRSVFTGKPKLTHRRDIDAEQWAEYRRLGLQLDVESVEHYRRHGRKEDQIAVDLPNDGGSDAA